MIMYSEMTVEEYVNLKPCGSVHPNHPDVVCIKKGVCPMDWHMGHRTVANRFTWIVQWGKDLESFLQEFGGPIVGRFLPITYAHSMVEV